MARYKVLPLSEITSNDYKLVGRFLSWVPRLKANNILIPNGFIITSEAFMDMIEVSALGPDISTNNFEEIYQKVIIPNKTEFDIQRSYSDLSGFADVPVDIIIFIFNQRQPYQEKRIIAKIGVKGEDALIAKIKEAFVLAITQLNHKVEDLLAGQIGISGYIHKYITPEASGAAYLSNKLEPNILHIEAVFGSYEESKNEGMELDTYKVDLSTLNIIEKSISKQEYLLFRLPNKEEQINKVKISTFWQNKAKIDDKYIHNLTECAVVSQQIINSKNEYEDLTLSWIFESGKLFITWIDASSVALKDYWEDKNNTSINLTDDATIEGLSTINIGQEEYLAKISADNFVKIQNDNNLKIDLYSNKEQQNLQTEYSDQSYYFNNNQNVHLSEASHDLTYDFNLESDFSVLLEGEHYIGGIAHGSVTFDPLNCDISKILVLRGDEDIPTDLSVAGLIIEDSSEILVQKLHEFFRVPVIVGAELAQKILKDGEEIVMDGQTGRIYVRSMLRKKNETENPQNEFLINTSNQVSTTTKSDLKASYYREPTLDYNVTDQINSNNQINTTNTNNETSKTNTFVHTEDDGENIVYETNKVTIVKRKRPVVKLNTNSKTKNTELSQLLHLMEEDSTFYKVKNDYQENHDEALKQAKNFDYVKGLDVNEFNTVKPLQNIISYSKKIPSSTAMELLEQTQNIQEALKNSSKEIDFDNSETYIQNKAEEVVKQELKKINFQKGENTQESYVPTATKVYIHLINNVIDDARKNYDGLIFSSTQEPQTTLEILESNLAKVGDKNVLIICPPYTTAALQRFIEMIYKLRNSGYKNLSLILPDYRNRKEIIQVKHLLNTIGLRRSSSFEIFSNISRPLNVFRISKNSKDLTDGVFIDLFRIKMNMLGVEKNTASTRYVEGMKKMVEYIIDQIGDKQLKLIISIIGFSNKLKILKHLNNLNRTFDIIACEQEIANYVKLKLHEIEKARLILEKNTNEINFI